MHIQLKPAYQYIMQYFIHILFMDLQSGSLQLQIIQKRLTFFKKKCIRLLTFSDFNAHSNNLFFNLDLLKLQDVLEYSVIIFFFNLYKGRIPNVLSTNFKARNSIHSYPTRSSNCLDRRPVKTTRYGINSISYRGVSMWNEFCKRTVNLAQILSNNNIKSNLKKQFLLSYKPDMN